MLPGKVEEYINQYWDEERWLSQRKPREISCSKNDFESLELSFCPLQLSKPIY